MVLEVAGATIFAVEGGDPAANIQSPGDALWWGLVTITTVGYGDQYPVTVGGRLIGAILLFAGIALFSVLTGIHCQRLPRPADTAGSLATTSRRSSRVCICFSTSNRSAVRP